MNKINEKPKIKKSKLTIDKTKIFKQENQKINKKRTSLFAKLFENKKLIKSEVCEQKKYNFVKEEQLFELILDDFEQQSKENKEKLNQKLYEIAISSINQNNSLQTNFSFYKIIELIDIGAYGKVFLGRSVFLNKEVAIKCFTKEEPQWGSLWEQEIQEMNILSELNHRNVVQFIDYYVTEKHFCYVSEYASRGNLFKFIKKNGVLDELVFIPIFKQIVEGMLYFKSQNVLHRDIKLENMLIDSDFIIKICDFGISVKMTENIKLNEFIGTPVYIAPEIVKGEGYNGFKSDVWSLGVLSFIALTGEIPFDGSTLDELKENILCSPFRFPKDIFLSDKMKLLISRMLEKDPFNRIDIEQVADLFSIKIHEVVLDSVEQRNQKLKKIENLKIEKRKIDFGMKTPFHNQIKALYKLLSC